MDPSPRLIDVRIPSSPVGAVLVLHGGASRGEAVAVSPTQLSVLRMAPIARRIAHAGRGRLAVYRLLDSERGWDARHPPVADVHWALEQLARRHDDLPVGLVGHSLGGRAALLAGGAAPVRSVVALASWLRDGDAIPDGLAGRRVLVVHGDRDRIASPQASLGVATRLARMTDVTYVRIAGGKHAMLRHSRAFTRLATDFTVAALTGDRPTARLAEILATPFPATVTA